MIGPLVFCLLAFSIYKQLNRQPNWEQSLHQIKEAFAGMQIGKLVVVILLMLINWGIEARKWQLVIRKLQPLSLWQSTKAIFTGTTLAFFTPNRMGEYFGRILYIEEGNRIKAISLTIVCSMAQLLVTMIAGLVGLIYLRHTILTTQPADESMAFWINTVLWVTVFGAVVLTLLYFRLAWLVKGLEMIPKLGKMVKYIRVLDSFNATILWKILSLSIIRYAVFVAQYYLLFEVFNVGLTLTETFASMAVVFLVLAIVPSIAMITELGVRWKASIELVQFFSTNMIGVLATSLSIWVINLVIPALIGSLLILSIRIFRNR
ncbi:flippase-like domain-containing protein [Pseudoflavitalea sp. G-6-1-2]|uniref:lysylphosphatidylglycerol synthase domain-containing protein n=1 Tax=Pseudoflavitalea sp. G-6-1-2 TaxID=2728841 RepID=UPI00146D4E13|nr:flippase-like domain-containing protein [Pseudoflavitalea sp. G-6-1-2]